MFGQFGLETCVLATGMEMSEMWIVEGGELVFERLKEA